MAVRASTVMVGEGGAVVAAEPPQGELSRKERKKSQLRDKLETKLKAISRNDAFNKAHDLGSDPTKPRPRTSVTGFWRKRKEQAAASVFVGNLPLDVTMPQMKEFFAGNQGVRWLPSTQSSCMAYLQYPDVPTAEVVCAEKNGGFLGTHKLRVNMANDRQQRDRAVNKREKGGGDDHGIDTTPGAAKRARTDSFVAPVYNLTQAPRNKVAIIE